MTIARKQHTCSYCEQTIQVGEAHQTWTVFPSQGYDVDVPTTFHGHHLCNAFWIDRVRDDYHAGDVMPDWEEAKREYDWDGWLGGLAAASDKASRRLVPEGAANAR